MKPWYESVYKGFLIAAIWIFLFSFGFTGETSFNAIITGYSLLILSISMIIIVILYNVAITNEKLSPLQSVLNVLMNTGPQLLMLLIVCITVYLFITYKSEIVSGHVSSGYFSFANISLFLFITQIYILYRAMETPKYKTEHKLPRVIAGIIYFLDILEALCATILFIILKYYTTDG